MRWVVVVLPVACLVFPPKLSPSSSSSLSSSERNVARALEKLVDERAQAGFTAAVTKNASRVAALDAEISELAWACVLQQQEFGEFEDVAGKVLGAYMERCGCSRKRSPASLVAAAAASAALIGDVHVAEARVAAVDGLNDDVIKSRLVASLCAAPARRDEALLLALSLLDSTDGRIGPNAWLAQNARRAVLDALVRRAREQGRAQRLDDDETALLTYSGERSRRRVDLLPADDVDFPAAFDLLDAAEQLARGAARGRPTRDAIARVAALAYHDSPRSLVAAKTALRRVAGGGDSFPAAVVRAVLREALGRGEALAARELLDELAKRRQKDQQPEGDHDATLDVVLEACADDGDFEGAAEALAARANATARASALALRACLAAVAAGNPKAEAAARAALAAAAAAAPYAAASRDLDRAKLAFDVALRLRNNEPLPSIAGGSVVAALAGIEAVATASDPEYGATERRPACAAAANELLTADAPGVVRDAAMRVFCAEGATRFAIDLAASRPDDANARYGALRCCALAARADALAALRSDGLWSSLAEAVALARAGQPLEALTKYQDIEGTSKRARAAILAALVSHPKGAIAAAALLDDSADPRERDDDDDDGKRVRAALARRLGNARTWAYASSLKQQQATFKVGETTYARLAAALIRACEARDAREAVVLLTRYGVQVTSDVQSYLDEARPRRKGTLLYKALFGTNPKSPPDGAERWFDSRAERRPPPIDVRQNRRHARQIVVDHHAPSETTSGASSSADSDKPRHHRRRRRR